jgi:hypothetical protein
MEPMKTLSLTKTLAMLSALTLLAGCNYIPSSYEYTGKDGKKITIYMQTLKELAACEPENKSTECEEARQRTAGYLPGAKLVAETSRQNADEAKTKLECMKQGKSAAACGTNQDMDSMTKLVKDLEDRAKLDETTYELTKNPPAMIPQEIELDIKPLSCSAGFSLYGGGYSECAKSDTKVKIRVPPSATLSSKDFAEWVKEQVDAYVCKKYEVACPGGETGTDEDETADPTTTIQQFIEQNIQNGLNGGGGNCRFEYDMMSHMYVQVCD